jgi:hypothetical protein
MYVMVVRGVWVGCDVLYSEGTRKKRRIIKTSLKATVETAVE